MDAAEHNPLLPASSAPYCLAAVLTALGALGALARIAPDEDMPMSLNDALGGRTPRADTVAETRLDHAGSIPLANTQLLYDTQCSLLRYFALSSEVAFAAVANVLFKTVSDRQVKR